MERSAPDASSFLTCFTLLSDAAWCSCVHPDGVQASVTAWLPGTAYQLALPTQVIPDNQAQRFVACRLVPA